MKGIRPLTACLLTGAVMVITTWGGPAPITGPLPGTQAPGALLVTPAKAQHAANEMKDGVLLSIFEETLYPNGLKTLDWIYNSALETDEGTVLPDSCSNVCYTLVTSLQDAGGLKANLDAVFSTRLLGAHVYPVCFEGATPIFMEEDSRLYKSDQTGGATAFAPDFAQAVLSEKTAGAFTVETPMRCPDNPDCGVFSYRVVRQGGNWVLDTFYYYQVPVTDD